MGCTRDIINVRLENKSYVENFIYLFNKILEDDFYDKYCKLSKNHMHKEDSYGRYLIYIEEEPLFSRAEDGAQIDFFVKQYVKKYPEVNFWLSYDSENLNCDGAININYLYDSKIKKLTINYIYGESASISYCMECDEYFDEPLAYLDDYDENTSYFCPECGEELSLEVERKTEIIKLEDIK